MAKFVPERDLPAEIVTAVGLLTIYASQLDIGLVAVLAAATKTRIAQADAILHSSSNSKARSDLVRAAVKGSDIHDDDKVAIGKLLDHANALSVQRNEWIHGFWYLKDGGAGYQVTLYWPNRTKSEKIKPLDAKAAEQIKKLCSDFQKITSDLCLLSVQLRRTPPAPQ